VPLIFRIDPTPSRITRQRLWRILQSNEHYRVVSLQTESARSLDASVPTESARSIAVLQSLRSLRLDTQLVDAAAAVLSTTAAARNLGTMFSLRTNVGVSRKLMSPATAQRTRCTRLDSAPVISGHFLESEMAYASTVSYTWPGSADIRFYTSPIPRITGQEHTGWRATRLNRSGTR
jgi:hypothetical protein